MMKRIEKEGGVKGDSKALKELDLEGDWDPQEHEAQMQALYDDQVDEDEDGKPTWNDDDMDGMEEYEVDDDGEGYTYIEEEPQPEPSTSTKKKKKKAKKGQEQQEEDGGEWVGDGEEEEWDGTEEMRKRKVEEYMDSREFNDVVRLSLSPLSYYFHSQ